MSGCISFIERQPVLNFSLKVDCFNKFRNVKMKDILKKGRTIAPTFPRRSHGLNYYILLTRKV